MLQFQPYNPYTNPYLAAAVAELHALSSPHKPNYHRVEELSLPHKPKYHGVEGKSIKHAAIKHAGIFLSVILIEGF